MKKKFRVASIIVLVLAAALAILAPVGPLPGFFIGGVATEAPPQWPDTSSTHEIELKVPGTLPRVVIIWVIQHDGELYVVGAKDSGWVSMLGEGGPVEMRLEGNTYALDATLVTQGWEPAMTAYVAKYRPDHPDIVAGFPAIEDADESISVFRLDRS